MTASLATVRFLMVATLIFPLAACPFGGDSVPEVPESRITRVSSDYDIRLPLDAYEPSPSQIVVYENAVERFLATCMRAKGFAFDRPLRPTEGLEATHFRRYGLLDEEHAKGYGYQGEPPSEDDEALQKRIQIERKLSPQGVQALTGGQQVRDLNEPQPTVGAGCYGEAVGSLGAEDLGPNSALVDRLEGEAYDRALADERVQDAFDSWAACMREAGYSYGNPLDPLNARWSRSTQPEPEADVVALLPGGSPEIRTALADATCNKNVNVAGIWMAVEAAYQDQVIEKHQEELARVQDDLTELLRRLGLGS